MSSSVVDDYRVGPLAAAVKAERTWGASAAGDQHRMMSLEPDDDGVRLTTDHGNGSTVASKWTKAAWRSSEEDDGGVDEEKMGTTHSWKGTGGTGQPGSGAGASSVLTGSPSSDDDAIGTSDLGSRKPSRTRGKDPDPLSLVVPAGDDDVNGLFRPRSLLQLEQQLLEHQAHLLETAEDDVGGDGRVGVTTNGGDGLGYGLGSMEVEQAYDVDYKPYGGVSVGAGSSSAGPSHPSLLSGDPDDGGSAVKKMRSVSPLGIGYGSSKGGRERGVSGALVLARGAASGQANKEKNKARHDATSLHATLGAIKGAAPVGGGGSAESEEDRRQKRMSSNRESARRSRQRKQRRVEDMKDQAADLAAQNADMAFKCEKAAKSLQQLNRENRTLRTHAMELSRRLQRLNYMASLHGHHPGAHALSSSPWSAGPSHDMASLGLGSAGYSAMGYGMRVGTSSHHADLMASSAAGGLGADPFLSSFGFMGPDSSRAGSPYSMPYSSLDLGLGLDSRVHGSLLDGDLGSGGLGLAASRYTDFEPRPATMNFEGLGTYSSSAGASKAIAGGRHSRGCSPLSLGSKGLKPP